MKTRSTQKEDESKMYVGSLMIWLNQNCEIICSVLLRSKLVWSFAHQFVDFVTYSNQKRERKLSPKLSKTS